MVYAKDFRNARYTNNETNLNINIRMSMGNGCDAVLFFCVVWCGTGLLVLVLGLPKSD